MHARLVAREQQRRECLWTHCHPEHVIAKDPLGNELADRLERTIRALCLPVVLDQLRGKTRGASVAAMVATSSEESMLPITICMPVPGALEQFKTMT
jgi:hypothetical protein